MGTYSEGGCKGIPPAFSCDRATVDTGSRVVTESSKEDQLQQALDGNDEALATLLMDYRPYLRLLAKRDLDSAINARVDPSDIVQQTCLEACRDISKFKGASEPALVAWIKTILRNNVIESIQRHVSAKKRSVRQERVISTKHDSQALPVYIDALQSTPSQRVMQGELAMQLAAKMEALPESQQEALRLRYLEGMSLAEISEAMGRSDTAVAGLLKRGLRQLRRDLVERE